MCVGGSDSTYCLSLSGPAGDSEDEGRCEVRWDCWWEGLGWKWEILQWVLLSAHLVQAAGDHLPPAEVPWGIVCEVPQNVD